jgi:hypothetical protein
MSRSEWQQVATQALREGRSLKEASAAYRLANQHVSGNPWSPEMAHRHHRSKRIGEFLRRGVPFREAVRRVDRGFDRYQRAGREIERSITHPFARENPDRGRNWLLLGAVAVGAYWLWQRNQSASEPGGTGLLSQPATLLPNASNIGPGSAPVVVVTATPGGY